MKITTGQKLTQLVACTHKLNSRNYEYPTVSMPTTLFTSSIAQLYLQVTFNEDY